MYRYFGIGYTEFIHFIVAVCDSVIAKCIGGNFTYTIYFIILLFIVYSDMAICKGKFYIYAHAPDGCV